MQTACIAIAIAIAIASEWSPQFPGYVAGAVEAAALGVNTLLEQRP